MTSHDRRDHTDTRRFRRESDRSSLVLVILTLIFVGGGLIALTYGPQALLIGLPLLVGGAALILIPWPLLTGIQKLRDRMEANDRKALQQ